MGWRSHLALVENYEKTGASFEGNLRDLQNKWFLWGLEFNMGLYHRILSLTHAKKSLGSLKLIVIIQGDYTLAASYPWKPQHCFPGEPQHVQTRAHV